MRKINAFFIDIAYDSFVVYLCHSGFKSKLAKNKAKTFLFLADAIIHKKFPVSFCTLEERFNLDKDYQ